VRRRVGPDLACIRCQRVRPSAVFGDVGYNKSLGYSRISIFATAAAVCLFGVSNRVAHKIASVVFQDHILVLSQMLILAYIVSYFSTLYVRKRKGIVTTKMLQYPKWKFGAIGFVEAFGLVMQLSAAVHLPGAIIPVLAQINIPFALLSSRVFLKRDFHLHQLTGCLLVVLGVLLSLKPYLADALMAGGGAGHLLGFNAALYASSYSFASIAAILKESILHNTDYGEEGMDVFVINAFSSLSQGLVVMVMVAIMSIAYGRALPGMGNSPTLYVQRGIGLFLQNPGPPLLYLVLNILFNVQVVNLLKKSNTVLTTLSIAFVVPLSFIAFSFPWPMLQPVPFFTESLKGLFLLTVGIVLYNTGIDSLVRIKKKLV